MSARALQFINYTIRKFGFDNDFGSRKFIANRNARYRLQRLDSGAVCMAIRLHNSTVAWVYTDPEVKRVTRLRVTLAGWNTQTTKRVVTQIMSASVAGMGWPRIGAWAHRLPAGLRVGYRSGCFMPGNARSSTEAYYVDIQGMSNRALCIGVRAAGMQLYDLAAPDDMFDIDFEANEIRHLDRDGAPVQPGRFEIFRQHRMPVACSRMLAAARQYVTLVAGNDPNDVGRFISEVRKSDSIAASVPVGALREYADAIKAGTTTIADVAESVPWFVGKAWYGAGVELVLHLRVVPEFESLGWATTINDCVQLSRGDKP